MSYIKSANTLLKYWHYLTMLCMQFSNAGGIIRADMPELLCYKYTFHNLFYVFIVSSV